MAYSKKGHSMPNEGKMKNSSSGSNGKTITGPNSGLKMSDERRADVTKAPSSRPPYPSGMC